MKPAETTPTTLRDREPEPLTAEEEVELRRQVEGVNRYAGGSAHRHSLLKSVRVDPERILATLDAREQAATEALESHECRRDEYAEETDAAMNYGQGYAAGATEARRELLAKVRPLMHDLLRGTEDPANWGVPEDYAAGWIAAVHAAEQLLEQP